MENLIGAWHAIRRNAETSQQPLTKRRAREFGEYLPANLRKIQRQLLEGYKFSKAHGALPPKGPHKTGKRPIVVAPLPDRIVQRAILDVLQATTSSTGIQRVLATPTSIGGIPGRGVDAAIRIFQERVEAGDCYVAGSDIKGFFTKISREDVIAFLRRDGLDEPFVQLVAKALAVELKNADQLAPDDLKLFPTGRDGVAQGCPLSALAGNIVLEQFDREMNGRGITCIRYIDDFLLIGRSQSSVLKALASASKILRGLGMDIYNPAHDPGKAFAGVVGEPHSFLGYDLIPGEYPPSAKSCKRLLDQIRLLISAGKRSIAKSMRGEELRSNERCYAQTLVAIDNTLMGWRASFSCSNAPQKFSELDSQVDRELHDFRRYFLEKMAAGDGRMRRRATRVSLLA
ncbi:reverse transcriptase domain-containing protein [Erythrobacter sp. 3-20A1M]|uniref:reverse transcriptase domain-containing protein n=1 Tax=Erythrobacter sp. 3-20A1M TaxID=2653850 RepID=UPI001BFC1296|nr:reverse transcriptase domain-containing protein [Erythrobacter sp. 3-20A1M]